MAWLRRYVWVGLLGSLCASAWAGPPSGVRAQERQDAVRDRDEPNEPGEMAREAAGRLRREVDGEELEGWAALPLASYTPETHLGLGAFGIYFFRPDAETAEIRPSSVALVGFYTTRHQAIVELIPELYLDDERWHLWTKLDFRRFPDSFWGVGPDTPGGAEERYTSVSYRGRIWLRREVTDSLYLGLRADLQHLEVTEVENLGLFDRTAVSGEEGGLTVGLGSTVGWDTRDNPVESLDGALYQVMTTFWHPAIGSDYEFTRLQVDLRQFVPIAPGHALAFQLYGELNAGDVPFYQMATIGGEDSMRGYFDGRYRDVFALVAQAEWRFPIYWRFRGVAFAGMGDVAPAIDGFDLGGVEVSGGAGLRYVLNEKERLNLRLDLGVGIDTWGAYVGIAEAF